MQREAPAPGGASLVASAPSDLRGNYGCEIWISTSIPLFTCDGRKYFVKRDEVSIFHTSPRYLFVRVVTGPFSIIVVSAHAPHSRASSTELQ